MPLLTAMTMMMINMNTRDNLHDSIITRIHAVHLMNVMMINMNTRDNLHDSIIARIHAVHLMNVMMESPPSGRRMSSGLPLLPVNPRVTDEASSCGKLSAAVVTDEGSCTV